MNVAVAGMGLIGGSFFKASERAGYATVGLRRGESAGLSDADIVLVALPPDATVPWIAEHAGLFKRGAIVVDACGVKGAIVEEMRSIPRDGWTFVGGHPMAGKEVSGYENSTAGLFDGKSMILTPDESCPADVIEKLKRFFASLGFAETVVTTTGRHDEMIAFTSQLGHVIAAAYAQDERVSDAFGFTAGSYANMTRIATADPETWTALYLKDRSALLGALDGFISRLAKFRQALDNQDAAAIRAFIAAGAAAKRNELEKRTNAAVI